MAANVANIATIIIGINDSTKNVTGIPTKSRNPVTLFAMVCGKTHFLYITTAEIWFMTFIKTITKAQIQSQFGSVNAGINLMQQQAKKRCQPSYPAKPLSCFRNDIFGQ